MEKCEGLASIASVDFKTVDIADLTSLQLTNKLYMEGLAVHPKRTVMEEALRKFLDRQKPPPPSTTANAARKVLDIRGFNLKGTENELEKRLEFYNDGKYATDYDAMEMKQLLDTADLFGIEGVDFSTPRSTVINALRAHVPGRKRKPDIDLSKTTNEEGPAKKTAREEELELQLTIFQSKWQEELSNIRRDADEKNKGSGGGSEGGAKGTAPPSDPMTVVMQSLQHIMERQATKGGTTANEEPSSKDGKKIVAFLNGLTPADVKLGYENDPETMGHRLRRALHFDFDDSLDPGVIAFGSQVQTLRTAIVQKVMSDMSYHQGKRQFSNFVIYLLKHIGNMEEKTVPGSKEKRVVQMTDFVAADDKMETELDAYCATWNLGDIMKIKQMRLMISTALGSHLSQQSIKSMNKKEEFDNAMRQRYTGNIEFQQSNDGRGDSGSSNYIKTEMGATGGGSSMRGTSQGAGRDNREVSFQVTSSAKGPGELGPGSRVLGKTCPNSVEIIGKDTPGAVAKFGKCNACGETNQHFSSHEAWECPKEFAKKEHGRTLPGFDKNGERVPSQWNKDSIEKAVKVQWLNMQKMGFFTVNPYKDGRQCPHFG